MLIFGEAGFHMLGYGGQALSYLSIPEVLDGHNSADSNHILLTSDFRTSYHATSKLCWNYRNGVSFIRSGHVHVLDLSHSSNDHI